MGHGSWDSNAYTTSSRARAATGTPDFDYHAKSVRGEVKTVHESLDPKLMKDGRRESRDSDEHPDSLPIVVLKDVTGSMAGVPVTLQKKLPKLMDVILAKAGIKHPHVLMGAIGDSTCDRFPFQVGQFESDNKFEEQLRNMILEGGGGGQTMESYGLGFRFAASHTVTDAWEKRGKKGYLFTVGDEYPWPVVTKAEVLAVFGVEAEADEKIEEVIARAQEKWEIFHIMPTNTTHGRSAAVHARWKALLGERFVLLEDENLICETVAGLIYMLETALGVDAVVNDLDLKGKDADKVRNALVPVSINVVPAHIASGSLPAAHKGKSSGVTKI